MQTEHKFADVHTLSDLGLTLAIAKWVGTWIEHNKRQRGLQFTKVYLLYAFTKFVSTKFDPTVCFMSSHDCEGGYELICCMGYQTEAAQYKQEGVKMKYIH